MSPAILSIEPHVLEEWTMKRIALLACLMLLMVGGTATFANTYGTLIADVGTKTHQAGTNATVQKHLLSQAEAKKAEISGVNLDEEAANLIRFQQAYQAAAQVVAVTKTLFDSLLAATSR